VSPKNCGNDACGAAGGAIATIVVAPARAEDGAEGDMPAVGICAQPAKERKREPIA
jgi:hypothetical protein